MPELATDVTRVGDGFLARSLRRRWRWIVAGGLLGAMAAASLVTLLPHSYTSTASVFLDPLAGNPYSPTTPSSRTEQLAALTTEAGVVLTDTVIGTATEQAKAQGFDIEPVRPKTVTEIPSNSQVIDISFTSADPETARVGSQELANAFLLFRRERAEAVYAAQATLLEERRDAVASLLDESRKKLDALSSGESSASRVDLEQQVSLYAQQLAQIRLDQAEVASRTVSAGSILNPASLPTEANGLSSTLLAAAALLLLLGAGGLVALVAEHVDPRIRDVDDLVRWGAPTPLGEVGSAEEREVVSFLRVLPGVEEALLDGAVVLVGSGASARMEPVALGFARAAASSGRSVCVVFASPRQSHAGARRDGLAEVLGGTQELDELSGVLVGHGAGVDILTPGKGTADLPVLVQSDRCSALVDHLAASFDLVLIAADWEEQVLAVRFARIVRSAVLVTERWRTSGSEVLATAAALRRLDVAVPGTVLATVPRGGRRGRAGGGPGAQALV